MHHEPEPLILTGLKFDEMISTSESCELECTLLPADGIQTGMAELIVRNIIRLRKNRAPISTPGRHSPAKTGQHFACDPGIVQGCGFKIQSHSQHAASNVASHGLWID